jgi:hypothetical protein
VLVAAASSIPLGNGSGSAVDAAGRQQHEQDQGLAVRENLNQNSMTQALGCYP